MDSRVKINANEFKQAGRNFYKVKTCREEEEDLHQAPRKSSIIISDKSNAYIKYFKRPTLLSSIDFMPCAKQVHRVRVMNNKSQAKEKI